MATKMPLTFVKPPGGLTEVINSDGVKGLVKSSAEAIASRASAASNVGGNFRVEMQSVKFARDAAFGASRPAAFVVANDDETNADEAENKILSKAVY